LRLTKQYASRSHKVGSATLCRVFPSSSSCHHCFLLPLSSLLSLVHSNHVEDYRIRCCFLLSGGGILTSGHPELDYSPTQWKPCGSNKLLPYPVRCFVLERWSRVIDDLPDILGRQFMAADRGVQHGCAYREMDSLWSERLPVPVVPILQHWQLQSFSAAELYRFSVSLGRCKRSRIKLRQ
jgi:hypothetical protein